MKALPNPTVPVVGPDGRPTVPFQGLIPGVSAQDVLVDDQGLATALFRAKLTAAAVKPLPNASVAMTNPDGTPTRALTTILMGLP